MPLIPAARRVSSLVTGALVVALASCGGAPDGVLDQCQASVALPPSVSTDILFVVDNSGSMREEQQKVVDQLHTFVMSLVNAPVRNDFQIGVVTTSLTQTFVACGGAGQTPKCASFPDESGRLQRGKDLMGMVISAADQTILSSSSGDPAFLDKVKRLIGQGVAGSGQEMGLETARRALSQPLVSTATDASPPGNRGFLRAGSRLLVIIVSDEDDCSDARDCSAPGERLAVEPSCGAACTNDAECGGEGHYCLPVVPSDPAQGRKCTYNTCEDAKGRATLEPVATYVDFLRGLDDGTGAGRTREVFLAVIGAVDDKMAPARCRVGADEAYGVAARYKAAVDAMGSDHGLIESICSASYATALTRIAALVNAPQTVELSRAPVDPRLLFFDVTRTDNSGASTTITCRVGEGFDYVPPAEGAPARVTFKGPCHLHAGDNVEMKVACAS